MLSERDKDARLCVGLLTTSALSAGAEDDKDPSALTSCGGDAGADTEDFEEPFDTRMKLPFSSNL